MGARSRIAGAMLLVLAGVTDLARAGGSADTAANADDGTAPVVSGGQEEEVRRVLALSNDLAYGEYLAGECASCHASAGTGSGSVPSIHGRDAGDIVTALLAYRSGERPNSTMRNIAGGLGDEEIAVLAHFFATADPGAVR